MWHFHVNGGLRGSLLLHWVAWITYWYMANESQSTYLCAKSNDIRHRYTVVGISRTLFRGPSYPGLSISCNTDHFFHVRYFFIDSNCNKIKDRGLLCSKTFFYGTFFPWVSTILQVTFCWTRSVFYHLWKELDVKYRVKSVSAFFVSWEHTMIGNIFFWRFSTWRSSALSLFLLFSYYTRKCLFHYYCYYQD